MASLYDGGAPADDIVSPLLGKAGNKTLDKFHDGDPEAHYRTPPTSTSSSSEIDSHGGSSNYDDSKTCCPQLLRSVVAVLIAAAGAAASILTFVYTPVDPLISSIWVYIMGGLCLLNSIIMLKNEKFFLFTLPTSSRAVIELLETRKRLEGEIDSLTEEAEILERNAARCEQAEIELLGIAEAQSSNIDEIVQLVQENEETLDLIRENLREKVVEDVVRVIINDHDSTQVIDDIEAKSLVSKIEVKMEDHGVVFDEEKCLHAFAMNSTIWGAINTVKKLLPPSSGPPEEYTDKLGKDDIFDMFYLPNNDQRQIGSVHAARAMLAGTHISLSPSTRQTPKQHRNDDWNDSCSSDSGIPKRPKNRLREQLHQFRIMSFPYFRETREARCLFGTLVILTLVNSAINVYFSYLIRDFSTALAEKEVEKFYQVIYKFLVSMVVFIPLQVMFRFIRVKLAIAWRKWLTARVLKLYFSNKVYYGLERQPNSEAASARDYKDRKKEMDNPDQRIQEDVSSFTEFSLMFFLTVVHTVIDLVSFSIILLSILPALFVSIILFASLGTLFTVLIGKVLIKLNYESLQREADFRFSLVRIRENCESIAFIGGEKVEERETKRKFTRVIENMTLINYATRRLDFFTTTYHHIVNILPILVLAPQYFTGLIEFGVISQARMAFGHILNDLSVIINQFNGIAAFMAGIDRLFLFMKAIQELDPDRTNEDATVMVAKESIVPERVVSPPPSDGILVKEYDAFESSSPDSSSPQPILTIRNLRLTTPDHKRVLIQNLNISLAKGQNLLITGVSGAGKSSLLRAIAGLWLNGNGEINRPSDVYFLPQKP